MDRENFDAIITRYLEKFDYTNGEKPEEYFKWSAIARFQKNWNLESDDLYDTFSRAIAKTSVLLDGGHSAPSSGIKALLKIPDEVEYVREAFRSLFTPTADLAVRDLLVEKFIVDINARIKKHWANDSFKLQTTRSALCYLALAAPKQNYFYMFSKADNWANYTEYGFDIGSGSSFSLPVYYNMCEELVSEINADPRLKKCNTERMSKAGVSFDDDYHTLAYDIIYCATTYDLYIDIPTYQSKSVKERIQRAKEREELNTLLHAAEKTRQELNSLEGHEFAEFGLTGRSVRHTKYGEGTILSHEGFKLVAQFGQERKTLVYPAAFESKSLVLASPEEMNHFLETERAKEQHIKLKKAVDAADNKYITHKAAFDRKWIKRVHNDQIVKNEDE